MGRKSRDKGARGEREWRDEIIANMPVFAETVRRGSEQRTPGLQVCDVEGVPNIWFEVKRTSARAPIMPGLRQGEEDTDGRTVVVASRVDRDDWVVSMRASSWFPMFSAWLQEKKVSDETKEATG